MGCQKLPEDEWLGARQLLLQVHSPVPLIYPRACGENLPSRSRSIIGSGSSPRIRGKHIGGYDDAVVRRLIPAHTGKTPTRIITWSAIWAHPRAYRENIGLPQRWQGQPGSSPHVRGKRARLRRHPGHPGLIPAHTGKTVRWQRTRPTRRAHPRTYGENTYPDCVTFGSPGSSPHTSPHTRGKFPPGPPVRV